MEKNHKFLVIAVFLTFALQACTTNPKAYDQAPVKPEVMGISDSVKLKADFRGVFYYINSNGEVTDEPVYLSNYRCNPPPLNANQKSWRVFRNEDLVAAIELQCKARKEWEAEESYTKQRRRAYGTRRY